ncbi:MAG TPA: helix-turn-helix domain-containing protein [Ktedonobacterales bacterium]|jgi:hypothetical protein
MSATTLPCEDQDIQTLVMEDRTRPSGFVQLPKLVLYARNLSRDAKLLYTILLGYAWQDQHCFPGYKRLCADMEASENRVRTWMRELEAEHLISQRRRGQGRTNIYLLQDPRTAQIEVQEHHKTAVLEPQEVEDNEEAVEEELEQEESGLRDSREASLPKEAPRNEKLFTHSSVFSTAKDQVLRALAGQKAPVFPVQQDPSPPQSDEKSETLPRKRREGAAQTHPLGGKRVKQPSWLSAYITDFSREFHDETATRSNLTRAAHLFEKARLDTATFIERLYAARRITQGRGNIRKRSQVGANRAWPAGYPNRMPYFFSVLEQLLGLKAAP